MSERKQKSYALEITLVVLAVVVAFFVQGVIQSANPPKPLDDENAQKQEGDGKSDNEVMEKIPAYNPVLTDLAVAPDWSKLEEYQYTISKEDFQRELDEVYTINGEWKQWVSISEESATTSSTLSGCAPFMITVSMPTSTARFTA